MKNRSIGSLILLAVLAPSCGGGGHKGAPKVVPPARWESQFRSPTTSNLRVCRFATSQSGLVMGEAGSFLRTGDAGATWTQLEYSPANLGGDVLAAGFASATVVAVGRADAVPAGSVAFSSYDSSEFFVQDDVTPRFTEPWVDVSVVVPQSNGINNATYRLRPSGMVDAYQGGILWSRDSRNNAGGGTTPWTTANAITFFALTGVGFVCGDNGGAGQIRRTIDNGVGWANVAIAPAVPPLNRFFMFTANSGFACGNSGTVVETQSGGSWNQVPTTGGPTGDLLGMSFPVDRNTGWVVGKGGTIYKLAFTAPSTWTWTAQTSGTLLDLYDVSFVDLLHGFAAGDKGIVLKTVDGGANWTEVSKPPGAAPLPQFKAVDFTSSGSVGIAVGDAGRVLRTFDGGITWEDFNVGVGGANLTGVCIPRGGSGNVAYLCGAGDTIRYHTAIKGPVGGTWQTGAATVGTFEAILFPKGDLNGVCVGGTAVFYTADGGLTWTNVAPGGTFHALGASPSGDTIYAAGNASVILSSVDDPATVGLQDIGSLWTPIVPLLSTTVTTTLNAIQAPSGTSFQLFAAGADGNVWRLSAGGAWTSTTAAGWGVPASLSFLDDLNGWAVAQGAGGGIYSTTNSGGTWSRSFIHVKINGGNNLRAIRMVSTLTGTAVGDAGMIMKTTTGGQ
ncbi:MAG: hypothetical protein HY293_15805 [Planctomycetes bacterium]|nr:hypothetical protein [Planctomycetota bacterium]